MSIKQCLYLHLSVALYTVLRLQPQPTLAVRHGRLRGGGEQHKPAGHDGTTLGYDTITPGYDDVTSDLTLEATVVLKGLTIIFISICSLMDCIHEFYQNFKGCTWSLLSNYMCGTFILIYRN